MPQIRLMSIAEDTGKPNVIKSKNDNTTMEIIAFIKSNIPKIILIKQSKASAGRPMNFRTRASKTGWKLWEIFRAR